MITTASCLVSELFSGRIFAEQSNGTKQILQGQLNVPAYQRPYLWGITEVDRLLKDLKTYFTATGDLPHYYLGSVILHQQGDIWQIIDGQQRLTTMALILAAASGGDRLSQLHFASPTSTQNIRHNYQYLQGRKADLSDFKDRLEKEINITLVVTDNEDDAYTFFETQNTGGVRLSGVDIIKAFHLRAIATEDERSRFAIRWEKQRKLKDICTLLLKSRYWTSIDGQKAPRRNHTEGLKKAIVREFSERTREKDLADLGYVLAQIRHGDNGWQMNLPAFAYSIRQPLTNGANLINYVMSFCALYAEILPYRTKEPARHSYTEFIAQVIEPVDGTLFTKELFEISLLCYAHRFGTQKLYEVALWLCRCVYSIRLTNKKVVKELSVPSFLDEFPLLDIILRAFDHEELISRLRLFQYEVNPDNLSEDTVKSRYVKRLGEFLDTELGVDASQIDDHLIDAITKRFPVK